jgi:XTP/dITP diphosphohydrolase
MAPLVTLVLASQNSGKLAELRALLSELPVDVKSYAELVADREPLAEDGDSFHANAEQKARAVCSALRLLTLADDSGLEVDALGGRPGVRSARFAHERATDAENNAKLLEALASVPDEHRQARFRCVLALVRPWAPEHVLFADGTCEGSIARAPRGSAGFGYAPLFLVAGCGGRSMADLSPDEKNELSHRGRALVRLRPLLFDVLSRELLRSDEICAPATAEP